MNKRCKLIEFKCKYCNTILEYGPRDSNKVPKYPHTKCSNCGRWISIKRSDLINSLIKYDNYQINNLRKLLRKNLQLKQIVKKLRILELLGQGHYAKEIIQIGLVSASNLSKIIKAFKSYNLIEQIQLYPKRYKLTIQATLILTQGEITQKGIQDTIIDKAKTPEGIESIRIHKIRFKNKLIQKPSWLYKIQTDGIISGLNIKRIKLNNWDKFLLFFNYQDFRGLEKIEVCNNTIIYNFNRNIEEQYVSSNKELEDYFKEIIFNCKQARSFLQQKGFNIDNKDPEFCQKPSFAVKSNGDPNALGTLGKKLIMTVTSPGEIKESDDSPKLGEGEEETDNIEKVKSYFDMPKELKDIKTEISELRTAMTEMAKGIKEMANSMTILTKTPEQSIQVKTDSGGGMFQ